MITSQAISEVAKIRTETHQFTLQVLQIPHVINVYIFVVLRGIWIASFKAIY